MPIVIDEVQVVTDEARERPGGGAARGGGGDGQGGAGGGGQKQPQPEEIERAFRAQAERAERVWAH